MRPCWRAPRPAIVLVTFSEPGVPWYTSIKFTGTTLPAGTVTLLSIARNGRRDRGGGAVRGLGDGAHRAGRDAVEAMRDAARRAPAAITKSGDRAVPLQATWIVTGP